MTSLATLVAIGGLAAGASAQSTSPSTTGPSTTSRTGGLAGLLGSGGLPNVASVGAGNAAGLLGYCLKNNLLGAAGGRGGLAGGGLAGTGIASAPTIGTPAATPSTTATTGAQSILERLTGRQGVTSSSGYAAGRAGQVQTGNGQALSLDGLRGQAKTRICSLVLNRAKSFL